MVYSQLGRPRCAHTIRTLLLALIQSFSPDHLPSHGGQTLPQADLPNDMQLACQLEPQHRQVAKCVHNYRRHMVTPLARSLVRHNGTSNGIFTTLRYASYEKLPH
jgi:hypothetical protein